MEVLNYPFTLDDVLSFYREAPVDDPPARGKQKRARSIQEHLAHSLWLETQEFVKTRLQMARVCISGDETPTTEAALAIVQDADAQGFVPRERCAVACSIILWLETRGQFMAPTIRRPLFTSVMRGFAGNPYLYPPMEGNLLDLVFRDDTWHDLRLTFYPYCVDPQAVNSADRDDRLVPVWSVGNEGHRVAEDSLLLDKTAPLASITFFVGPVLSRMDDFLRFR